MPFIDVDELNRFDLLAVAVYATTLPFLLVSETPMHVRLLAGAIGLPLHVGSRLRTFGPPLTYVGEAGMVVALTGWIDYLSHMILALDIEIAYPYETVGGLTWEAMDVAVMQVEPHWYFWGSTGLSAGLTAYVLYLVFARFAQEIYGGSNLQWMMVAALTGGFIKSVSYGSYVETETTWTSLWLPLAFSTDQVPELVGFFTLVHGLNALIALLLVRQDDL